MWVVKLGGSLAYSPELPHWLSALAHTDAVIVPGGGPFADTVRQTQKHSGYTDACAHDMALLGMHQYGLMLSDLGGFRRFSKPDHLPRDRDQPWVWLPWPEDLAKAEITPSWNITSDSLAIWLTERLASNRLLLVKSVTPTAEEWKSGQTRTISCKELSLLQLVDPAFASFFLDAALDAWLCGPTNHTALGDALDHPENYFIRIAQG